ncbi:signal peptidase I [Frigoribacterium sp. CFBP 13729]|uniref:signal peptidase I n=1 Tax=unclassified Frigoribacterium TaxID=2627005 RepID=UPI00177E6DB4|nr:MULTISPECIES: signal peptidase I [unclassified Frigoribacterium]MBD8586092.1 signal peptidase I [Frigoribacterium sp. CFBP 8766]MBD8611913.1 signal peptidase I [Frigoribacterium sp. CFBP 13729]
MDLHRLSRSTTASEPTTAATPSSARRPARRRDVLLAVGVALALGLLVALAVLHLAGARTFVVRTASMGTAAPVGTLVVTTPVTVDELRAGDVVTFTPPGRTGTTFTHRVVDVSSTGVATRGDASQADDPWRLTDADLVGRASVLLPGVGWLARALPWLVAGGVALRAVTLLVPSRTHRSALRVVGSTVVVAAVSAVLRPFTAATVLWTTASDDGLGGTATVASTGMLPSRLATEHGSAVVLASGELGTLDLPALSADAPAGGGVLVSIAPHLPPLGWLVFGLVCCLPLLWCLVVGLAPQTVGRRSGAS